MKAFNHPLVYKTLFSVFSSLLSDCMSQSIETHYLNKSESIKAKEKKPRALYAYDSNRLFKYAILSIIMSPLYYYQYSILEPALFSDEEYIQKMLFDQLICIPIQMAIFFTLQSMLEGKTLQENIAKTKQVLLPTILTGYKIWPLFMLIIFRFIPPYYCEYVINIFSIGFGVYLSYMAHS